METVRRQPRGTEFGEFLRSARERRGLTLQQVSHETKIPFRHLDAFERGDLTVVPHGMYRRAEVRAYARAVGLDQNVAVGELERALVASGVTPARVEPHASVTRPILFTVLGIAGVAGALLAAWLLWTTTPAESSSASAHPAVVPSASAHPDAVSVASSHAVAPGAAAAAPAARATTGDAVPSVVGTSFKAPAPQPDEARTPQTTAVDPTNVAASDGTGVPSAAEGLVITSDPPGARVVLDGIGRGTTPATIQFLSPGDRILRVIKDGYVSQERRVHVSSGRATTINVTLQAASQ